MAAIGIVRFSIKEGSRGAKKFVNEVKTVSNDRLGKGETAVKYENRPILSGIGKMDIDAVNDCLNKYGGLIWALAQKFTSSRLDAEKATEEIFSEIWRQMKHFNEGRCSERDFVFIVAYRLLSDRKKRLQPAPEEKAAIQPLSNQ